MGQLRLTTHAVMLNYVDSNISGRAQWLSEGSLFLIVDWTQPDEALEVPWAPVLIICSEGIRFAMRRDLVARTVKVL